MNDIELAGDLLDKVVGYRGKRESISSLIERAYLALSKLSPKWTRRRVKSLWYREVSRIDHREIADMEAIIKARIDHENYKQETAAIVAVATTMGATKNGTFHAHQSSKDCRVDSARDSCGNGEQQ